MPHPAPVEPSSAKRPRSACRAEPPACTLFMTSRCNLACAWCRRTRIGVERTPPMSLTVVRRLLEQYPGISVFAMAGQGEPTLAPEFAGVALHLAGAGKGLILDTNGLNAEPTAGLKGCFSRISLSLYGHDRRSFRAYTGVDGFDAVMDSYSIFRKVCPQVCISYIVDKDRLRDLRRVLTLCDTLEPSRLLLYNPLCYDDGDRAQAEKIITAGDADVIAEMADMSAGRGYPVDLPPYPDYARPLNSCRSYCAVVNVDGNGNIGGCLRKVPPDARYGNALRDSDCFNTPEMLRLRRRQMVGYPPHPECATCFGNWGYGDYRSLLWKKDFSPCEDAKATG
ncbi:MAG: radical SAM protein [Desulfovibrio sp.]|jgi:MoaA/NifB/PqqE/SkfB family radical SAM enzyme|nr:radical SAM protein [Desulfovibrio sp.]